jgi:3-oxoacyl-[acyl-carrier protein] reductase
MDLGLKGKWAVVCGASKGLGFGCAQALAQEGVNLVINARTAQTLDEAARTLTSQHGVQVYTVAGDVGDSTIQKQLMSASPQVDILINNAGGPPPGDFRDFTHSDWIQALEQNMLAPLALIKLCLDPMVERRFGRIVNITSKSVKMPIDSLILSNGARAGLTGAVATLAREVVRHNVTINNLLPGKFATDRMRSNAAKRAAAANRSIEEQLQLQANNVPAQRLGQASEFGHACAFLCSAYASYITGQNLLIDGGEYPGVL